MGGVVTFPIGILDQSPVVAGATPREAILATIALARAADRLGYARYWLAEHHSMHGLSDASPEVLLARLTAETSRIRLGTGGIMLPHYSSFKVAETFRMLDALAPGRVDLGVGRAPGGVGLVNAALESRNPGLFPEQIQETIGFLEATTPPSSAYASLHAMPSGPTAPEVWMLGSSDYGALLAARMGLPYAYAHFIGGDQEYLTRLYRSRYRPNARHPQPRCIVAAAAIVAPTDEEAADLALPLRLWRTRIVRGQGGPIPSLEEARAYPWAPREREESERGRRLIYGSPATVRHDLEALVEENAADEAMIVTITPDYASRLRSYELLADAFELGSARSPRDVVSGAPLGA
jgi:luciferase family oxidoreductase group 1